MTDAQLTRFKMCFEFAQVYISDEKWDEIWARIQPLFTENEAQSIIMHAEADKEQWEEYEKRRGETQ